ncbi:right-handed parallel beta-helix repeat-containing protein [Coraliomargarita sp. SDUM461004]|uniref:Right-handed parallel beta-helix repeat-containing protein n=1 Tax=Thalassobacterium sedimentorum TaxID=3041258 RepID=A0ABU1ADY6_9BACT|nr:right-handed parallel beta-helix repeat-containing protein [Coraliomargarita sp. SDUM461004]MDQ8192956.1 right-handed parallel beta-helix repeat-containing protein [Coraliomargarita sp. SDUM461004]
MKQLKTIYTLPLLISAVGLFSGCSDSSTTEPVEEIPVVDSPTIVELVESTKVTQAVVGKISTNILLQSSWANDSTEGGLSPSWEVLPESKSQSLQIDSNQASPFSPDFAVLRLEDNNAQASGASLRGRFASTVQDALRVTFDFRLEGHSTNQPTFVLEDSEGTRGLFFTLNNNNYPTTIPGRNAINRTGSADGQLVAPVQTGKWYQAELLIWPADVGYYTVTLSEYGGEPVRVESLPLRHKLKDFSSIRFIPNTQSGEGTILIGKVLVETGIDLSLAGELRKIASTEETPVQQTIWVDAAAEGSGDGSQLRPYSSLEAARDRIREWNRSGRYPEEGVVVELAGGIYNRESTFKLTSDDSGEWNRPVVYRAAPGSTVRLIGGRSFQLSDFRPVQDSAILRRLPNVSRGSVLQLDLKSKGITEYGELPLYGHSMSALQEQTQWRSGTQAPELFFDEVPMTLARWPNEGFALTGKIIERGDRIRDWMDDSKNTEKYVPPAERNNPPKGFIFEVDAPERLPQWKEESDLRLYGYWFFNWSDQALSVAEVDVDQSTVQSLQPSAYAVKTGQRYFAYNALSELDVPGEWYLDRHSGVLYLYPLNESSTATIDLSLMDQPLLKMDQVSYVRFEGIEFVGTRADGIQVKQGTEVVFDHCRIGNVGGTGIRLDGLRNRFQNGEVFQTGRMGIRLDGGNRALLIDGENVVINSHIHHYARIEKTYQAAISINGVGQYVAHCEVNYGAHLGLAISGNNHLIELNHIYDVSRETDDMAAIYGGRSWTSRGTVIRHNLFRDITGYRNGTHRVSGIYLDDGFSGTTVTGNVFINVAQGLMFNGGRENRAQHNIFIDVENTMRATDMTSAFQTWGKVSWGTLNQDLKSSPYMTEVWKKAYPRLPSILQDEPNKPKYSVIKDNARYQSPIIMGATGIHDSMRAVGWVENNLELSQRPGHYDPDSGRFIVNPACGLFEAIPELQQVPFLYIGRY